MKAQFFFSSSIRTHLNRLHVNIFSHRSSWSEKFICNDELVVVCSTNGIFQCFGKCFGCLDVSEAFVRHAKTF